MLTPLHLHPQPTALHRCGSHVETTPLITRGRVHPPFVSPMDRFRDWKLPPYIPFLCCSPLPSKYTGASIPTNSQFRAGALTTAHTSLTPVTDYTPVSISDIYHPPGFSFRVDLSTANAYSFYVTTGSHFCDKMTQVFVIQRNGSCTN